MPHAVGAFRCKRRLGNEVGDVEGFANRWTQPIGRLVVEMIGKPSLRSVTAVAQKKAVNFFLRRAAQRTLATEIAFAFVAAKLAGQERLVSGNVQRPQQLARH